jgi:hypothetical protein
LRKVQVEDEYRAIPYIVRGSDAYTHKCKVRVHHIMDKWAGIHMPYATMITISPRGTGSPYQRYLMMKILWSKFTNWLRSKGKTKGNYLWAMEPTKRNYPHYHIILGRRIADPEGLHYDILDWWRAHGVDIGNKGVKVEACRGSDQARHYALKYVTKGADNELWSAILWLTHGRAFGVSRPLAGAPLINSQSKYLHTCCSEPIKIAGWDLIGVLPAVMAEFILTKHPPPDEIRELCKQYLKEN